MNNFIYENKTRVIFGKVTDFQCRRLGDCTDCNHGAGLALRRRKEGAP